MKRLILRSIIALVLASMPAVYGAEQPPSVARLRARFEPQPKPLIGPVRRPATSVPVGAVVAQALQAVGKADLEGKEKQLSSQIDKIMYSTKTFAQWEANDQTMWDLIYDLQLNLKAQQALNLDVHPEWLIHVNQGFLGNWNEIGKRLKAISTNPQKRGPRPPEGPKPQKHVPHPPLGPKPISAPALMAQGQQLLDETTTVKAWLDNDKAMSGIITELEKLTSGGASQLHDEWVKLGQRFEQLRQKAKDITFATKEQLVKWGNDLISTTKTIEDWQTNDHFITGIVEQLEKFKAYKEARELMDTWVKLGKQLQQKAEQYIAKAKDVLNGLAQQFSGGRITVQQYGEKYQKLIAVLERELGKNSQHITDLFETHKPPYLKAANEELFKPSRQIDQLQEKTKTIADWNAHDKEMKSLIDQLVRNVEIQKAFGRGDPQYAKDHYSSEWVAKKIRILMQQYHNDEITDTTEIQELYRQLDPDTQKDLEKEWKELAQVPEDV